MGAGNVLSSDTIYDYLQCKYLGYLRLGGHHGGISEYTELRAAVREEVRRVAIGRIKRQPGEAVECGVQLTRDTIRDGPTLLLDSELEIGDLRIRVEGLQRVSHGRSRRDFQYVPILFNPDRQVHTAERVLLSLLGFLLGEIQGNVPEYGIVYCGNECRASKVRFSADRRIAERLLVELSQLVRSKDQPRLLLNDHCPKCEFRAQCHDQAVREDNLSLFRGMGQKAIGAYSRKGISTLTQLAHTFRPRRKGKRDRALPKKRYYALQALAVRDRRVYVLGTPQVPQAEVRIYLDIEGVPDEGFVYLIGMVVCDGASETSYSFWADTKVDEHSIFEKFLGVVDKYEAPRVYAYGGYERTFLKRMRRNARRKSVVDRVLTGLVNVLGIVYTHYYFPTYTNGLKDIGRALGCRWTEDTASGLQSLVWRRKWEGSHDGAWKAKLITYNLEDCVALRAVTEFLKSPPSNAATAKVPVVVPVPELDRLAYAPRWGVPRFANADFDAINNCAHFDYQQQRVFVRTSKTLKKRLRKSGKHHIISLRVNRRVEITASKCPVCKGTNLRRLTVKECKGMWVRTKRSLDLAITSGGIQRYVTECRPVVYACTGCGARFKPERYQRIAKHGHALMSWAMHAYVAHRLSYATLEHMFRQYFGLTVFNTEIHMFKGLLARYYRRAYDRLLTELTKGSTLHVDETEVHLQTGKGYVWAFASLEEVVYLYRPNREGGFLKDLLKDFRGVLISDFYAAYDALECPQQKCLIHLIRDLNQLLLANPFDDAICSVTADFGTMLRAIVATIDEHGLKHRHLQQHDRAVRTFFEKIDAARPDSEVGQMLRDRLLKNRNKLFTFLQHDQVPWNNNNAENAIKQFAYFRENRVGILKEDGLDDYLVLLSLYQTCRYKGLDFLDFLLSGERDIDAFATNQRRRRYVPSVALYPKRFTPPHLASFRGTSRPTAPEHDVAAPNDDEPPPVDLNPRP